MIGLFFQKTVVTLTHSCAEVTHQVFDLNIIYNYHDSMKLIGKLRIILYFIMRKSFSFFVLFLICVLGIEEERAERKKVQQEKVPRINPCLKFETIK